MTDPQFSPVPSMDGVIVLDAMDAMDAMDAADARSLSVCIMGPH